MDRRQFLKITTLAGVAGVVGGCQPTQFFSNAPKQSSKPNVIVIFTDDQGFADLGCQKQRHDIKTPNIDALARDGVRCTNGYVTAPQCCPSRAGLMAGRYQQRFGVDHNGTQPPPLDEILLPERLKKSGYATGMVGKWHLDPRGIDQKWVEREMPNVSSAKNRRHIKVPEEMKRPYYPSERGFDDAFYGQYNDYRATYDLDGNDLKESDRLRHEEGYRIDIQTDAATTFIDRHHQDPFFLYLAYFAPHVPLEATEKYLERFPETMPNRRRYALAMMSAFDDGVGKVRQKLKDYHVLDNTIIFFISDNGAPLKNDMEDKPISFKRGAWDGSRNDPWIGEKGMLSEGGIHVPFIVSWPEKLPKGIEYHEPVISLDVAATAVAAAGAEIPCELDGVNIIPYLDGTNDGSPHEALYWRFWSQSAIRRGQWKYLKVGGAAEYLFNLKSPDHEKVNLIEQYPEIASRLRQDLEGWAAELDTPGIPNEDLNPEEKAWYKHYFGLDTSS